MNKVKKALSDKKLNQTLKRRIKTNEAHRKWYNMNRPKRLAQMKKYNRSRLGKIYSKPPQLVGEEFKVKSDNVLVTSDYHLPFLHEGVWNLFLKTALEHTVKDLVIGGDFWDLDAISTFYDDKKAVLMEEVKYVKFYLGLLMGVFERIYIVMGNHEARWSRWTQGKLDVHALYTLTGLPIEEIHLTNRDYLTINNSYRVCHSKNYSQTPCRVAGKLALKYQMNILNAHGHFCEEDKIYTNSFRRDKKFYIADIGGFFDCKKIPYMMRTTTYPDLDNGFCLLQDNKPELFRWKDYK